MAKSALERFNAYMNGMEDEAPEAEINIDVDVKVVEAEDLANEGAEIAAEVEADEAATEMAEDAVEQAEMVAKILREEGLTPGMLSLLKANPIFSDVWNVPMPARESLDATGTNMAYAERIAVALEEKAEGFKATLVKWWESFKAMLKRVKNWVMSTLNTKEGLVKNANELLKDYKGIDDEKAKDKKVTVYSLASVKKIQDAISKIGTDKGEDVFASVNNLKTEEISVADLYKSNGINKFDGEYFKAVKSMLEARKEVSAKIDRIEKEGNELLKKSKNGSDDSVKFDRAKFQLSVKMMRIAAGYANNAAGSFTKAARAVASCEIGSKKEEEKKD